MRPRGKTQQRYNEAIQILSGTQVKNQNFNSKMNVPDKMVAKRRQACPQTVLHLWDAIAYIKQQKQIPNFERLTAYMKRVYNLNPTDLERQLNFAVSDKLIVVKKSLGCKGSKVGIEQDGYRIPEEIEERDGHDWYCFECHRGGEVLLCTTCHRVFHEVCFTDDVKSGKFVCPVCKENPKTFAVELKKTELNTILGYTCIRLKEKTRELHRIPHPDDEKWRFNFLIYEPIDLVAMEEKMKANGYGRLGDFFTDAQQIVHNVVVYFGMHSRIAEMARQMLGDCEYDLQEIVQCLNCYKMSNTKNDSYWFCQPCEPPHELVYAKVKGFPYWPAKVIRKHESCYDVRFFGAHHQRALVEENYVKPISISFQKLGTKKTPSFDRAYKELRHHQQLVEKSSKRRSVSKKPENSKIIEEIDLENDTVTILNVSSKSKTQLSRKRKSSSTPLAKPLSAKKIAKVPVKKNKRIYQESPTSSSPKNISSQEPSVSEDNNDHNLVSSSSQETAVSYSSVGIQTDIEVTEKSSVNLLEKDRDKNANNKLEKTCDCSAKYEQAIKDLHSHLEEEHKKDKSRTLKEFSENLHKELQMENEKQKYLSSTLDKLQQEHREAMSKLQEDIEAKYKLQIKNLTEEHKTFLSETKKKQWCYNCENEAIYHCCWNTSYCSVECQQVHWHKEHKRTCRRKR